MPQIDRFIPKWLFAPSKSRSPRFPFSIDLPPAALMLFWSPLAVQIQAEHSPTSHRGWECCMNRDAEHASCDVPEEPWDE
eukprot:199891-Pelagomonas_calceolata.AAC.1